MWRTGGRTPPLPRALLRAHVPSLPAVAFSRRRAGARKVWPGTPILNERKKGAVSGQNHSSPCACLRARPRRLDKNGPIDKGRTIAAQRRPPAAAGRAESQVHGRSLARSSQARPRLSP